MSFKSVTRITSGLQVKPVTGDPTDASATGIIAYNSTTNSFRGNVTGTFSDFAMTDTAQTLTNKTIAASANTLLGVVQTVGALDGQTANASGLAISGQTVYAQSASTGVPGLVNTTTQSFAGNKTIVGTLTVTGALSASNFSGSSSGTNTGDVTLAAAGSTPNASGGSLSGQQLTLQPADSTNPGVVSTGSQSFSGAKTFNTSIAVSGSTSGAVTIQAPSSVTPYTVSLPSAQGASNTVLRNNGSGTLSWGSNTALLSVTTATGNLSLDTTNDVVLTNASSLTITLPTAVGNSGKSYYIKNVYTTAPTATVTIATTSSQTIDGATSYIMNIKYEELTVVSDGSNWNITDRYIPLVACRYTTAAGQTFSDNVTATVVYGTQDFDTHSTFNSGTGVFTAPRAGKIRVTAQILWGSTSSFSTGDISIRKNVGAQSTLIINAISTTMTQRGWSISDMVSVAAGDTIDIRVTSDNSSGSRSLEASSTYNFISIQYEE